MLEIGHFNLASATRCVNLDIICLNGTLINTKITRKVVNGGLIFYIGGQALAVGAGLAHHYLQREIAPIVLTTESPRYSIEDILYGAIMKPQYSFGLPRNPAFEYKITLLAGTTNTSPDATMVFLV